MSDERIPEEVRTQVDRMIGETVEAICGVNFGLGDSGGGAGSPLSARDLAARLRLGVSQLIAWARHFESRYAE